MMRNFLQISLCLLFVLPALGKEAKDAQSSKPMEMAAVFDKDILPILKARCIGCHGGGAPKADLDLRTVTAILQGGKSGPAIRLDAAETSLLYEVASSGKMPPKGEPLTAAEQGKIRVWINESARDDLKLAATASSTDDTNVTQTTSYNQVEYTYWSFTPPQRPPVPVASANSSESSANPIDSFLREQLSANGLSFSPPATKSTLIRRVYLDMLGILPSPQAIERYEADDTPIAFQRLLDEVLADPRYGERWGRHWLDVAGYSDSAGVLSADQDRQLIWRFRDYVIRALNRDLPYDQFVREQLAGDEVLNYWDHYENSDALPRDVVEALSATGFLRTAPDASRPDFKTIKNVNGLYYYPTIDSQLQILTSGLMGITVKCAKCHDHKFDPLTQKNYYQLQAVFMSVYNPDAWIPFRDRKRPVASKRQVDAAAVHNKQVDTELAALKNELATLRAMKVEELFLQRIGTLPEVLRADVSAAVGTAVEKQTIIQKYLVQKFGKLVRPDAKELEAALLADYPAYKQAVGDQANKLTAVEQRRQHFDYVYAAYDVAGEPYTPLLRRGDAQTPGAIVRPGVPEMIQADKPFVWKAVEGKASTSLRRTAFANWLTQSRHPLTSRVMANRLWLHHFGEGLVSTVEDFGWAGEEPQHQQLLDWLAVELESNQWSLKHLHRLILSSQAYQQSSAVTVSHGTAWAKSVDPNNRLLWRQNLRRMEAEPLRDSILHVAGALRSDMYGAPTAIVRRSDGEVVVNDGKLPQKRSIYLRNKRSAPVSILQLFDQPDIETNCTRRDQSTVPLQALSLLNSDLVVNAAEAFADRVLLESPQDPIG
ncbi:MAG: PSD1 and planctomycete cytochrome C domain-containing protein [Planctomycetota bacterium]|nr:PSD1 and planctomycete cytochrome C domain-containing protein [Planctomycetota bacterium]